MSLSDYSSQELKEISFVDLAYEILKTKSTPQSLHDIANEIVDILGYTQEQAENKISSFYTQLTIDGRFVILSDGKWDLRDRHTHDVLKLESNTFELELDLYEEDEEEEEFDSIDPTIIESEDDYDDKEDIKNLVVINEEDL